MFIKAQNHQKLLLPVLALLFLNIVFLFSKNSNAQYQVIFNKIDSLIKQEKYQNAVDLYPKLLETTVQNFGTNSLQNVKINILIGKCYFELKNFSKAKKYFNNALNICKNLKNSANTQRDSIYANIFYYLADINYSEGNFSNAEKYYLKVLNLYQTIHSGNNKSIKNGNLALIYNNLGALYQDKGDYNQSEKYYLQAMKIYQKLYTETEFPNGHNYLATSYNNLGLLYYTKGNYIKAEEYYLKTLTMLKKLYSKEQHPNGHPYIATIYNNLGGLYKYEGNYSKSEEYYLQAMKMYENLYLNNKYPNGHLDLAGCYNNLGLLYYTVKNYSKAEKYYLKTLKILKILYPEKEYPNGHLYIATALNNLGLLYYSNNDIKMSKKYFSKALKMLKKIFPKKEYPNGHRFLASTFNNLGKLYLEEGKYTKAKELYLQALEIHKKLFPPSKYPNGHPDLAGSYSNIAGLYLYEQKYSKAEEFYLKALNINLKLYPKNKYPTGHPDLANNYSDISSLYLSINSIDKSVEYLQKAITIEREIYKHNSLILTEKEKEFYSNKLKTDFLKSQTLAEKLYNNNQEYIKFCFNQLLFTKGMIYRSVKNLRNFVYKSANQKLKEKFFELVTAREYLNSLSKLTIEQLNHLKINFDSLNKNINELQSDLIKIAIKNGFKNDTLQYNFKDIQKRLRQNEAAIEIVRYPVWSKTGFTDTINYAIYIVKKDSQFPEVIVLKYGNALENKYLKKFKQYFNFTALNNLYFKRYLDEPKDFLDINQFFLDSLTKIDLRELYKQFWQPIASKLSGISKVYLSLDGVYHQINLLTLLDKNNNYLADQTDIIYLNSLTELMQNRNAPITNKSIILFGNPDYNLSVNEYKNVIAANKIKILENNNFPNDNNFTTYSSFNNFKPLPSTQKEVETISDLFKQKNWLVSLYTGKLALEEIVKSVKHPRILHIATHGGFEQDMVQENNHNFPTRTLGDIIETQNPLFRSKLAFAGANTFHQSNGSKQDGLLNAYEVINMDLEGTNLVVLSACKTGLGTVKNGEGVQGLQRSFQIAGAKNIIMSLWDVETVSTMKFMRYFYKEYLNNGELAIKAFKYAQKKLRKEYSAPIYWGAFIIIGK